MVYKQEIFNFIDIDINTYIGRVFIIAISAELSSIFNANNKLIIN